MATFTVHVPPGLGSLATRAERTAFVRDGFSLRAFLLGPAYLLYHRLWAATVVWCLAAAALTAIAHGLALPVPAGLALYLVLAILTGLEAGEARHRAYRRRGFVPAAVLCGMTRDESERRFFAMQAEMPLSPGTTPVVRPSTRNTVVGLFPEPGGRA